MVEIAGPKHSEHGGRRGIVVAGWVGAPVLVALAAAGDEWGTTRGFVGAVVALTVIAYLVIVPTGRSLGGRDDGLVAFICGTAAVVLAVMMTFLGGFAIAPALATIPLAASIRSGGGWYRWRLIVSLAIFAATCWLYVASLASYADYSRWL